MLLGGTQYFPVAILIDGDCNQNADILVLTAPVSTKIDSIHINVRIFPALQRTFSPVFDVDICFLVQLVDGGRSYLASPKSFRNVFHPTDRDTRQIHLDQGFFYGAFPSSVAFNDGGLEGYSLEPRHVEFHVARCFCQIPTVMAAAVALPDFTPLVFRHLGQLFRFLFHNPFSVSSTLPRTNSLITSSFNCAQLIVPYPN